MLEFQDWGVIKYEDALEKQLSLVELVSEKKLPGFLVFCSHPPVVTLGRKTQEGDVYAWQGPTIEISRGGRATYHGPSQLVVYPIYNLDSKRDIAWYLRGLENAIIATLKEYGIESIGKSLEAENTGVWVGHQKIASLGIAIKKWVSYHGAAINLDDDEQAFTGMKPCGFERSTMVSLEKLLGHKIDRVEFGKKLRSALIATLQR